MGPTSAFDLRRGATSRPRLKEKEQERRDEEGL